MEHLVSRDGVEKVVKALGVVEDEARLQAIELLARLAPYADAKQRLRRADALARADESCAGLLGENARARRPRPRCWPHCVLTAAGVLRRRADWRPGGALRCAQVGAGAGRGELARVSARAALSTPVPYEYVDRIRLHNKTHQRSICHVTAREI